MCLINSGSEHGLITIFSFSEPLFSTVDEIEVADSSAMWIAQNGIIVIWWDSWKK